MKTTIRHIFFFCLTLLLSDAVSAQVVILQQGFDSTSGSQANGTWTNVDQIQNGGNDWSNSGTGNLVVEGNYSCSGWSTCNDKTGHTYGITGGAPVFKGTGTNVGYGSTNSTYFAIFDDYDASSGTYGTIYSTSFNLSGYTSCNLTFYWNNANTSSSYIQVQYYNGSTWTGATNFAEGTGSLGWHEATMSLPSSATEVVFFLVSDYEYYPIGLDQIEIYGTPSCSLTASISSHTNASPCSTSTNGAATAAGSSGTTPYTYSWAPSGGTNATASNLAAGTYTCTVKDANNCTATATVSITAPTAVTGTISSQTNVSCNGGSNGSATISASGGTSPYTYSWTSGKGTNTTASSLTAGSYTCTITDANSCTGTIVVSITQPGLLRDSISSSTNVLCYGASTGSATVGVKGGTTPYTYNWSLSGGTNATASSLAAGSYTVTVTDHNSCTATATITLTQPGSVLSASISSYSNAPCHGENGSATVSASGGTSPYTYSWSSGHGTNTTASLPAGTFTVTVTDHNSCTATATVTITQPANFTGTITTYNVCGSGSNGAISVQLSGGTTPYTYSWNPNVSTTDSAGGLGTGAYTVTANDANGCGPLVGTTTITTVTAETVTISSSTNVSCYGGANGSATASASPTHAYVWSPGGSTNATISSLSSGIYTVVATETDGCTSTATVNITQPSALSASISSSTNVSPCGSSTNGSATVSASGGTSPYTYSWTPSSGLTGATTATAGSMKEGTYTCTVTDAHSCTATATVTIGGPVPIRDSISSSTNVLCHGASTGSATVGVKGGTSPYTYSWSPSGGTNAMASNLAAGTYTCTITDASSCTGTATVTITQASQIRDSISSSTNVLCNGASTGSATVGVKGGASPYTYSWSPSGGTHATASSLAAGTYSCTITDANGCTGTVTVTITQPSALTATISSYSNAPCNGENGSATVSAGGGTSPYTYSWSSGRGTHTTASLPAGSYTVTVTDNNSCTATATVTITQPAVFSGEINTYNICGSGTGQIGVDLSGGTPPYTYSWSPGTNTTDTAYGLASGSSYTITVNDANGCGPLEGSTTISTITAETVTITSSTNESCYGGNTGSATASASPTHNYIWAPGGATTATISSLAAGTYTVTSTETDGCEATATVTITQPAAISPVVTYTNTCSGSSNGSASVSVSGGTSPYTYSWNTTPAQTTTSVSGLAAGNYTVTVTDHNSCVATATVTIGTNATPTVAITPSPASFCVGSSVSLAASGATTYTWSPSTGLSPTTGASVTANPGSSTTYTVTGTTSGCNGTQTVIVTVNPLPTLTVTPSPAEVCSGSSVSITASGASTYTWAPNTNLSATTGATVSANPTVTTTYTVTGTNSSGCVNTQSVTVTVDALPTVTVTPSSTTICGGSSTSLTASGATTYTWAPSTGLSPTTGATVTANPASSTIYTVTGTSGGCSNTQTVVVAISPAPTLTVTPSAPSICSGSSASLTVSGASTYTWAPNTNLSATTGATVTASPTVTTTYTITGTNSVSCTNTQTVTVTVNPSPSVSISSSTNESCNGGNTGSAVTSVSGGTSPYTYAWSNVLPAQTSATATGLYAGTYTVTATDANGCNATATVSITQPAAMTLNLSSTPSCGSSNGSASSSVSGGTSPYIYSWSPAGGSGASASSLTGGTYTLSVADANGCMATGTVTVITNATLTVSINPPVSTIYTGGTVTLAASGATSYSWNTGATGADIIVTPTVTTTYTVTGTAGAGCTGMATATVNVNSAEVPTSCDTCIGVLNFDTGKVYLISVWAKNHNSSPDDTTYLNPEVTVSFPSAGTSYGPFLPSGKIIDGWQRIEGQFKVPHTAANFAIQLSCVSGQCNFDDIRVFPFNGTLKTYVYDPNTLRLVAVLDERNYATIYEYDEEGKLIRVKKETERGIMTIQESRTSMQKQK